MFIECTFECRIANRDLINTTLEVQQFIYIEILIWLRSFSNSKTHPIDNCYRFTWGMAWNVGPKVEIATLELPELKNQISDESVGLEEEYDNTYMNIGRSVGLYDDDDVKYESRPLYADASAVLHYEDDENPVMADETNFYALFDFFIETPFSAGKTFNDPYELELLRCEIMDDNASDDSSSKACEGEATSELTNEVIGKDQQPAKASLTTTEKVETENTKARKRGERSRWTGEEVLHLKSLHQKFKTQSRQNTASQGTFSNNAVATEFRKKYPRRSLVSIVLKLQRLCLQIKAEDTPKAREKVLWTKEEVLHLKFLYQKFKKFSYKAITIEFHKKYPRRSIIGIEMKLQRLYAQMNASGAPTAEKSYDSTSASSADESDHFTGMSCASDSTRPFSTDESDGSVSSAEKSDEQSNVSSADDAENSVPSGDGNVSPADDSASSAYESDGSASFADVTKEPDVPAIDEPEVFVPIAGKVEALTPTTDPGVSTPTTDRTEAFTKVPRSRRNWSKAEEEIIRNIFITTRTGNIKMLLEKAARETKRSNGSVSNKYYKMAKKGLFTTTGPSAKRQKTTG